MPSSPPMPTRRRKSSSTGPQFNNRTLSQYSLASPSTPRPTSSYDTRGYFESCNDLDGSTQSGSATTLGNLADELADAFDDDEHSDDEQGFQDGAPGGLYDRAEAVRHSHDRLKENVHPISKNSVGDEHAISISPVRQGRSDFSLKTPKQSSSPRHRRKTSQYDGSDHGDDSDLEVTHSAVLEARLATVESLARQGTQANRGDADLIVQRMADSLKGLRPQTGIENGVMRLITAHTALTTHISHQTRTLSTLTHPLVSPLSTPPNLEIIDDMLPLLTSLVHDLPITTSHALSSLHNMHASTSDLVSVLTYLSDTLHVMRQTTNLASRRLRAARELVVEMRREAEARETGIDWVEEGNWECRLAGRECAGVCVEVVGGFEEVCASWRARLADGMTGVEVGAG